MITSLLPKQLNQLTWFDDSGGGLKTGADGKHIRTEDQKESCKNYITLRNAMLIRQPIGVVVGKQAYEKGKGAKSSA